MFFPSINARPCNTDDNPCVETVQISKEQLQALRELYWNQGGRGSNPIGRPGTPNQADYDGAPPAKYIIRWLCSDGYNRNTIDAMGTMTPEEMFVNNQFGDWMTYAKPRKLVLGVPMAQWIAKAGTNPDRTFLFMSCGCMVPSVLVGNRPEGHFNGIRVMDCPLCNNVSRVVREVQPSVATSYESVVFDPDTAGYWVPEGAPSARRYYDECAVLEFDPWLLQEADTDTQPPCMAEQPVSVRRHKRRRTVHVTDVPSSPDLLADSAETTDE